MKSKISIYVPEHNSLGTPALARIMVNSSPAMDPQQDSVSHMLWSGCQHGVVIEGANNKYVGAKLAALAIVAGTINKDLIKVLDWYVNDVSDSYQRIQCGTHWENIGMDYDKLEAFGYCVNPAPHMVHPAGSSKKVPKPIFPKMGYIRLKGHDGNTYELELSDKLGCTKSLSIRIGNKTLRAWIKDEQIDQIMGKTSPFFDKVISYQDIDKCTLLFSENPAVRLMGNLEFLPDFTKVIGAEVVDFDFECLDKLGVTEEDLTDVEVVGVNF